METISFFCVIGAFFYVVPLLSFRAKRSVVEKSTGDYNQQYFESKSLDYALPLRRNRFARDDNDNKQ